jgi:hypothetical protein
MKLHSLAGAERHRAQRTARSLRTGGAESDAEDNNVDAYIFIIFAEKKLFYLGSRSQPARIASSATGSEWSSL